MDVSVEVEAGGDGVVSIYPGAGRSDQELDRLLRNMEPHVFNGRVERTFGDNGGGSPVLVFTSRNVFERGTSSRVELDTRQLCEQLRADGYSTISVWFRVPVVPHEWVLDPTVANDEAVRDVTSCVDAPRGAVTLRPSPGRFWAGLAVAGAVLVSNALLFAIGRSRVRRRRPLMLTIAGLAVVASVFLILTGAGAAGDNAEAAGQIGHLANMSMGIGLIIAALVGPIGAIVQAATIRPATDTNLASPWPPPRP